MRLRNIPATLLLASTTALASGGHAFAADIDVVSLYPLVLYCALAFVPFVLAMEMIRRRKKHGAHRSRISDMPDDDPQLQRLRHENEKLKADLKKYSTIINMAPYPIWQRDNEQHIQFYNLSYGEAIEDVADFDETPELDKKVRVMAKQAIDSNKAISDRRHIVVDGARKLFQISELPVPEEKMTVGFAFDMSEVE